MRDISNELVERMSAVSEQLEGLKQERLELENRQESLELTMEALRTAIRWEAVLQGRTNGTGLWAGIDLGPAVARLSQEHPTWVHAQIRDRLIADGFDFKGKNPGLAVNMVLQRSKRGGS